ncbi:MAG: type II secretion system major pseudopilin GspG [Verrucomicrobiaceae bacterium]|nr:type II secretion system major pseudopilin GspG [Verrucomicrobiaceae bacterium]
MKTKIAPLRHPLSNRAFTLLEMMIVLLIIAMILGVVAAGVNGFQRNAEIVTTEGRITALSSALTSYRTVGGMYPTQGQGLSALYNKPGDPTPKRWSRLVKNEAELQDAWGRKIEYRFPGTRNPTGYDIWSIGPDGQPDTDDDIGNW